MTDTLPSLTTGKAGVIRFDQINRVFRATELVESSAVYAGENEIPSAFPMLARLTTQESSTGWVGYDAWRWEQVRAFKSGATFDIEPYGVNSSQWSPPSVAIVSTGAKAGELVQLWPLAKNFGDVGDGIRSMLLGVPVTQAASTVASGVIVAVTNTGDPLTLGYQGYIVARHQNISMDLFAATGLQVPCINSFELSGELQTQVQTQSPGTKTLLRLPVGTLVGPLVKMPSLSGELWLFTQANAYGVAC